MAGGLRKWVGDLPPDSKREALLHGAERGAQGLLNAREDIRQKLVDEAWFGRSTVNQDAQQFGNDPKSSLEQSQGQDAAHAGTVWEHEGHTQDHYENPNWDNVRAAAHDAEGVDTIGHAPQQADEWADHKAQAEALYGNDPGAEINHEDLYGPDREPDLEP